MISPRLTIVDGCTAAAHVAYAFSETATVYPITPIASMGQTAQQWAVEGRQNVFGSTMQVVEMESELGAAGAMHGALNGGSLATTFTASQGLLLMIPNMYKMAGELLPGVIHVGCRSVATHALSIFGDHSDAMACRQTGFCILVSDSVQATADLAAVAHVSAIAGSLPVMHMFDGWRTSNEMSTVELPDYADLASLVDHAALERFRRRAMNPQKPDIRGTAQNPDVFFQNREASNRHYDAMTGVVKRQMNKVARLTGRHYDVAEYHGAADATAVMVIMGSAAKVANEAADWINGHGGSVGVINVRLYRPFPTEDILRLIPPTCRYMAVMDRTKEPGAPGEPLYLDMANALLTGSRADITLTGGRYGLSSKDFSPAMAKAVFDGLRYMRCGQKFTVGINDDVTHLSLPVGPKLDSAPQTMRGYQFYGMGSDGTVGAAKQSAKIISALSGRYVQAYFEYSAWKSGGYTVSSLRTDTAPVEAEYALDRADYIGVNRERYARLFDLAPLVADGTVIAINTAKTDRELSAFLPKALRKAIKEHGATVYAIDAAGIAAKCHLGVRVNTIMEAVFFKLGAGVDFDRAVEMLQDEIKQQYIHEGDDVVANNIAAVSQAAGAVREVNITDVAESPVPHYPVDGKQSPALVRFVDTIAEACLRRQGNSLPVSLFSPDGFTPCGETQYEHRTVALQVPVWDMDKCVQCTLCSLCCSHAAIRPYLSKEDTGHNIPAKDIEGRRWQIQVSPTDCTGCGSCAVICPAQALTMTPLTDTVLKGEQRLYEEALASRGNVRQERLVYNTLRGSQLRQPLLEFSGACGGCGETPYVKLLTQLFGDDIVIANATGCSSIWGADYPSMPYRANSDGHGPAWANSLFEDNAEYAMGIALALKQRGKTSSVWAIGGDGWAYDIGFAGLDHVLSQNLNINILVMDTECYSNTGGQMSKATPLGAVAKYAPEGKRTVKKDLGRMAMTYGHVYVGQISLAANPVHAINTLVEASWYPGPSLVIAYCPCINHGIRAGMSHSVTEMRLAVKTGYWPLWNYDPRRDIPLTVVSGVPDGDLGQFLDGESRYADLKRTDPEAASILRTELDQRINKVYSDLLTSTL